MMKWNIGSQLVATWKVGWIVVDMFNLAEIRSRERDFLHQSNFTTEPTPVCCRCRHSTWLVVTLSRCRRLRFVSHWPPINKAERTLPVRKGRPSSLLSGHLAFSSRRVSCHMAAQSPGRVPGTDLHMLAASPLAQYIQLSHQLANQSGGKKRKQQVIQ